MAGILFSGEKEPKTTVEFKNPPDGKTKYPTTSTGKQGSFTGTSLIGSVIPNKASASQKPVVETKPTTPTTPATPTGTGTSGTTGAGSNIAQSNRTGTFKDGKAKGGSFLDSYFGKILSEKYKENGMPGFGTSPEDVANGNVDIGGIIGGIQSGNAGQTGGNIINNANTGNIQTSIEDIRNKYSEALRRQHEYAAEKLRAAKDEALRENWVLQQQAEAALPEQLAAAGLNGGAAETTLAALKARYQGNRNDIRSGYMDNLGGISEEFAAQQAETEREYNEKWIDYLLSLAKSEKEFEQKKALAAMQK